MASDPTPVLMVGTGEYTTGYGASGGSDKKQGVVALTMFDLRQRGLVGAISLCGTNGTKMPAIRAHMKEAIGLAYPGTFPDPDKDLALSSFPADDAVDPEAYLRALDALPRGSAVTIFTPDDTHYQIALEAIKRGHHVLVTKPITKTLASHLALCKAAEENDVLVAIEVHKRWDPIYSDARDRLRRMGKGRLGFLTSYMSQPKAQLKTFASWLGKGSAASSDISFYLNSHHVDASEWFFGDRARPISVVARASTGVADSLLFADAKEEGGGAAGEMKAAKVEDSITLLVQWENFDVSSSSSTVPVSLGTATYTAAWTAPKSDVHSQQRFFCLVDGGEVNVDQAHRGYSAATDSAGFASLNPLFMRYTPSDDSKFVGHQGYGYRSIESFVAAVNAIRQGKAKPRDFDSGVNALATVHKTLQTTAILEAGRRSLDCGGKEVKILYPHPSSSSSSSSASSGKLDERLLTPVDLR